MSNNKQLDTELEPEKNGIEANELDYTNKINQITSEYEDCIFELSKQLDSLSKENESLNSENVKLKKKIDLTRINLKIKSRFDLRFNDNAFSRMEEIKENLVKGKNNVLYVGDQFTYKNMVNEFNVINLSVADIPIVEYLLECHFFDFKIDMLFVESFWRGSEYSWIFFEREDKYKTINYLIDIVKRKSIKTVLYNKEDPVHFDMFLPIAKKCDYVVTTASESIADYEANGIMKCKYLPFFVNEAVFNPFNDSDMEEMMFFAGSYYPYFPERCKFMDENFPKFGADFDLFIYDRNINEVSSLNRYPQSLREYIKSGGKDIEDIVNETISYKYALNMNSVIDSNTMIARRVFEQLALGKIVVSNYAKSIELANLEGVIFDKENNYANLREKMKKSTNSFEERVSRGLKVLREHSSFNFKNELYQFMEIDVLTNAPRLLVTLNTINDYFTLLESLENQSYNQFVINVNCGQELRDQIISLNPQYRFEWGGISGITIEYDYTKSYTPDFLMDSLIRFKSTGKKVTFDNSDTCVYSNEVTFY